MAMGMGGAMADSVTAPGLGKALASLDSLGVSTEALDSLGISIEALDSLGISQETLDSLAASLLTPTYRPTVENPLLDSIAPLDSLAMTFEFVPSRKKNTRGFGFVPEPIRAMWLGIIFPGGGQIYNRKFWKLPVFYGGFLGCMYALNWNGTMLRDYSQAYLDIMDDDPETKSYEKMLPLGYDITGKEDRFKTIFKNKKDRFRKFRDLSIFAFIGVYALSIVDAYVDAELSTYDISRDLSIHFEPATITPIGPPSAPRSNIRSYGVLMALTF